MRMSRRAGTVSAGAVAAGAFALVAESAGTEHHPAIDLVAGCVLLASGLIAVAAGSAMPGALLIGAGVAWFLATAGVDDVVFLHRALVVHALVLAVAVPRALGPSFARRAVPWLVIGVAYVAGLDRDLAVATPWTVAVALGTITSVGMAAVVGRWPRLLGLVAVAGTATWAGEAIIARTWKWFDPQTRLLLYVVGLGAVAASIASWAILVRRAARVSSGDLVRDDGRGTVRVAFRGDGGEFEDIIGDPFAAAPGESTVLVDLGPDLGVVLVAHGSTGLDSAPPAIAELDDKTIDGLRLVAANRRAVQSLRKHAAEVAASAQRLQIADDLAAAQLSTELGRMVVPRIERAVAALGGDDSATADEARRSLALVVDEIQGLAAGLAPAALRGGLGEALAALADNDTVSVHYDADDATIDPANALVLYFIATECVTNSLRHGAPSFVVVELCDVAGTGEVELTVTDDGRGVATDHAGGSGLAGLRSRAEAADGVVNVRPQQGGGTVVTVRLPSRVFAPAGITPP